MTIRTHLEHWLHRQWSHRGLLSWVLRPLSYLVALYTKNKAKQPRPPLDFKRPPVIVVGNIIVGGAGKTPVVLAICEHLKQQGWQPGIISRGYGVHIEGAPRLGQGKLDASQFGDEPTLLAQQSGVPIAVHPKRIQALKALCTSHPEINVVIADDGLQHQALDRDIEVIVQDARGIANGLLLPAGPLRESPERLTEADWLITQLAPNQSLPITPHPTAANSQVTMRLWPSYFEQLNTGIKINATDWLTQHQQQHCSALAAIGQPTRFFAMLTHFGILLDQQVALPDHAQLPASSFSQLSAQLVLITAKDAVKCQQLTDPRIWIVHVETQFTPATWLADLQQKLLKQ